MGTNPTLQLVKALGYQDRLQNAVADIQTRMDSAILAESNEDIAGLRLELAQLKAALGQARNVEAFWRGEVKSEQDSRKSQADLGKG